MAAFTPTRRILFSCPGCGRDVYGTVHVQFNLVNSDLSSKTVDAVGEVTGLQISHDCVPKVTR